MKTGTRMVFFQGYSQKYLEMAQTHDGIERVANPDGYGRRTGDSRDTVASFLSCKDNVINATSISVQGCMNTTACSNKVLRYVKGKAVESAWQITPDQIIDFLETLPEDHHRCAELAVGALK